MQTRFLPLCQEVSYRTRLWSCSITTSLQPGSSGCFPGVRAEPNPQKPLLSRCLQGLGSAQCCTPASPQVLWSSSRSGWHLLLSCSREKISNTQAARIPLGEGKTCPSLPGPSPRAHLELGDGAKQQQEPHLRPGFNSHTPPKLCFQRAFILLGCLCIPPRTPEPDFQGSSSLQPWSSQPSIPSRRPPGQAQT